MNDLQSGSPPETVDSSRRVVVVVIVTVVLLAAWNVGRIVAVPADRHLVFNASMAVVFAALGVIGGLDLAGFGLARRQVKAGSIYGGTVFAVIGLGLVLVAIVPATADLFRDDRVLVDRPGMVFQVLVEIPLGTVLLEELAFRGTLLGLLRKRISTRAAVLVSSGIFGLWHIAGALNESGGDTAAIATAGAVVGTLVATTIAGIGFAWLRVRSDSLIAPMLAHLATNSLTYAAAWAVSQ